MEVGFKQTWMLILAMSYSRENYLTAEFQWPNPQNETKRELLLRVKQIFKQKYAIYVTTE